MVEDYTSEQVKKYQIGFFGVLQDVVGSALKYSSIIAGIYSICKDEKDFEMATIAGFTYVLGDLLKRSSEQLTQIKQFSKLEDKLKE